MKYCDTCGEPLFFEPINKGFINLPSMPRMCKCKRAELEKTEAEQKEHQRLIKLEKARKICFRDNGYQNNTFDKDDMQAPKLSKKMLNYSKHFATFKENGQGLLLYGKTGTGKSFYTACIANYLLEQGYTVVMTTISDLIARIQREAFEKDVLKEIGEYDLLILDDLGTERDTSFSQEKVFDIIDKRYRNNLPMVVSTNLTSEQIANPKNTNEARVFGRLIERCLPIEVNSVNRRTRTINKDEMEKILNL